MKLPIMPRNVERVADDEEFRFACHDGVPCFTECCRQLELALTPYDVLRLKNSLGLHSREFLDRYVIIEHEEDDVFPRYYLTMVDDGRASCVFVDGSGCRVYPDRPGACRAYPLGRAARRKEGDNFEEFHVLLREDHCKGFAESPTQTPLAYSRDQGLIRYNRMNDIMSTILQHEAVRNGMRPSPQQLELFTLCLYDLDTFRSRLADGSLQPALEAGELQGLEDDEALLGYALEWLKRILFGS